MCTYLYVNYQIIVFIYLPPSVYNQAKSVFVSEAAAIPDGSLC